jgi:hypothetical protein
MEDTFVKDSINKMFEIAGYSKNYEDVLKEGNNWFQNYTMDEKQRELWKKWFVRESLLRKIYISKRLAEKKFEMVDLNWGLKQV